jgi:hypothetical protein
VGASVGTLVGMEVGRWVGVADGSHVVGAWVMVGSGEGLGEGTGVGTEVGSCVGNGVGCGVGFSEGSAVGSYVGLCVGLCVGDGVCHVVSSAQHRAWMLFSPITVAPQFLQYVVDPPVEDPFAT